MAKSKSLTIIEGFHADTHDGGVAIYDRGEIVALAAERVDRVKHSPKPGPAYDFLVERLALKSRRNLYDFFRDSSYAINHPLAHAASAFYPSPFKEAAILVVDGQGPYDQEQVVSLSVWTGNESEITELVAYPQTGMFCANSLGHFYSAITYYLGFGFSAQGKTMALAAYGADRRYVEDVSLLNPLSAKDVKASEDFIRTVFFKTQGKKFPHFPKPKGYERLLKQYSKMFGAIRKSNRAITIENIDLAFAGQHALEDALVNLCIDIRRKTGLEALCFAGGVALNVAANTRIARESGFKQVFIQPAAGDDGQAIGKLHYRMHREFGIPRREMKTAYLGPAYDEDEIEDALKSQNAGLEISKLSKVGMIEEVASRIIGGQIVAWFQGRSEIGPRALGHRSILADPRDPNMRERLNCYVKHREWFQPFALSILDEDVRTFFDMDRPSPFMLFAAKAFPEAIEKMPSGIHVDGTSRVQTLTSRDNEMFYDLVKSFATKGGVPAVINTSFNDKDEPIVETPIDAITAFRKMKGIDCLAIGEFLVVRHDKA